MVEAKTREELGKCEKQLLAYMGMSAATPEMEILLGVFVLGLVHTGRIERHKVDTTVDGISTDSMT